MARMGASGVNALRTPRETSEHLPLQTVRSAVNGPSSFEACPIERSGVVNEHRHRNQPSDVADPVDHEHMLAAATGAVAFVPRLKKKVAVADGLPTGKQNQQVVGSRKHQHRKEEQVQMTHVAVSVCGCLFGYGGVNQNTQAQRSRGPSSLRRWHRH